MNKQQVVKKPSAKTRFERTNLEIQAKKAFREAKHNLRYAHEP